MQLRELLSKVLGSTPLLAIVVPLHVQPVLQKANDKGPPPHLAQETLPPYSFVPTGTKRNMKVPCLTPPC